MLAKCVLFSLHSVFLKIFCVCLLLALEVECNPLLLHTQEKSFIFPVLASVDIEFANSKGKHYYCLQVLRKQRFTKALKDKCLNLTSSWWPQRHLNSGLSSCSTLSCRDQTRQVRPPRLSFLTLKALVCSTTSALACGQCWPLWPVPFWPQPWNSSKGSPDSHLALPVSNAFCVSFFPHLCSRWFFLPPMPTPYLVIHPWTSARDAIFPLVLAPPLASQIFLFLLSTHTQSFKFITRLPKDGSD